MQARWPRGWRSWVAAMERLTHMECEVGYLQHEVTGNARAIVGAWIAGATACADPWWPEALAAEMAAMPKDQPLTAALLAGMVQRATASVDARFAALCAEDPGRQWPTPKAPRVSRAADGFIMLDWLAMGRLSAGIEPDGSASLTYWGEAPSQYRWSAAMARLAREGA